MRKKLVLLIIVLSIAITGKAQFEEGKLYVNTSLSGLNLSYNGNDGVNLGLQAEAGYLVQDNWMILASASYQHLGDNPDYLSAGVGVRYHIVQNGLYLAANVKLVHGSRHYNDLMPGVEVGYTYFLSRTVTLEPALYYDQSLKNHSNYSTIGFKIGFGFYL